METAQRVSPVDLQTVDIFAGLSAENLERIARYCTFQSFKAGDYVAVQGKMIDHLMAVNQGKVAVEMRIDIPRYSHTVTVTTLTSGRVCAWSALVPPHMLTASISALEDTRMVSIKGADLLRIFQEDPVIEATVMRNLATVISSRLRDNQAQLTRLVAEVIKLGR